MTTPADHPRVLVTRRIPEAGLALLREVAYVDVWDRSLPPPRDELLRRVEGIEGLLSLLTDRVDDELLDAAGLGSRWSPTSPSATTTSMWPPAHDAGSRSATRPGPHRGDRRPRVRIAPGAARRLPESAALVTEDRWLTGTRTAVGRDVSGATLGIVGFGRIGREVARRAQGFGMRILAHSRGRAPDEVYERLGAEPVDLDTLSPRATS